MTSQPVFRFAPSPNGHLHLGHAYSALLNRQRAQETGGRLLLRIEDIDTSRCTPDLVRDAIEDLAWLGLTFEPEIWRQSARFPRYAEATARLQEAGLLYPCFCTRTEIQRAVAAREEAGGPWPRDPDGAALYPGTCARLSGEDIAARRASGLPAALRLDMHAALQRMRGALHWDERGAGPAGETGRVDAVPARWGDAVIVRKDIPASYHLAVVVDDAAQAVSEVVRGQDLFHATALHRLLQALLELPAPAYHHHALIRDDAGGKLAKSALSKPLRAFRSEGVSAAALRARLGFD